MTVDDIIKVYKAHKPLDKDKKFIDSFFEKYKEFFEQTYSAKQLEFDSAFGEMNNLIETYKLPLDVSYQKISDSDVAKKELSFVAKLRTKARRSGLEKAVAFAQTDDDWNIGHLKMMIYNSKVAAIVKKTKCDKTYVRNCLNEFHDVPSPWVSPDSYNLKQLALDVLLPVVKKDHRSTDFSTAWGVDKDKVIDYLQSLVSDVITNMQNSFISAYAKEYFPEKKWDEKLLNLYANKIHNIMEVVNNG